MPYEEVIEPISGLQAFGQVHSAAVQSQAAFLLLLGIQIRGDFQALSARAAATQKEHFLDIIPEEDRKAFPLPPTLSPSEERFADKDIQSRLTQRYRRFVDMSREEIPSREKQEVLAEILSDLVTRLHEEPTRLAAAELMEACLFHPDPLPQVAAAASYFKMSSEPRRLLNVLEQGTQSQESLVREVAATALARIAPDHPNLAALTRRIPVSAGGEPSHTSLLVHGTFARNFAWWQPGGEFHSYVLNDVRHDLYADAQNVFSWSGAYDDAARALGAQDLVAWVNTHNIGGLDHLFAHSHGGSVAMLASQHSLDIDTLVLLSCPVHVHKYLPNFKRVKKVVSVHVRYDLVILADGGSQKYSHPQIQEHVLPVWFDHSATHYPHIWQRHNIPSML